MQGRTRTEQENCWRGLQNGLFDLYSPDHCPFRYAGDTGKRSPAGLRSFRHIPNGIPGVETRLPILFSEGARARSPLARMPILQSGTPRCAARSGTPTCMKGRRHALRRDRDPRLARDRPAARPPRDRAGPHDGRSAGHRDHAPARQRRFSERRLEKRAKENAGRLALIRNPVHGFVSEDGSSISDDCFIQTHQAPQTSPQT
jgi:hypothetical protein